MTNELIAQKIEKVDVSILDMEALNAPDTKVNLRFLSLDVDTLSSTVQLDYLPKGKRKWVTIVTRGNITSYARDWFCKTKAVKDQDNVSTGEYLTNYQRYLQKREMDVNTSLLDLSFNCENHSDDYALNPFSVRFNRKFDSVNIELVNMPYKIPIIRRNPITGKDEVKFFRYPVRRDDSTRILRLPKAHYKRVIVR